MEYKPGPEMDALIAERVMGLEPWPEQDPRWKAKAFRAPIVPFGVEPKPCQAPLYSTDISAAWKVLEEFWYPSISFNQKNGKWKCSLSAKAVLNMKTGFVDKSVHWAYAYSAPEAICKAALAAKENLLKEN